MNKTKTKNEVQVEITVYASAEKAFRVFTERCNDWWPPDYKLGETERTNIVMEPRVGGRWYELGSNGMECDWGKVQVWEPPYHLAVSWQIGVGFVPNQDLEKASRVDVRFIEDIPGKTIIKLKHSQFEKHGAGWNKMRDSVAGDGGWPAILENFSNLVITKH